MSQLKFPISEPQLLLETRKYYKDPGEVVLIDASSEHSTIAVVTNDTFQFYNVDSGKSSPVVERTNLHELEPWAVNSDGRWVAIATSFSLKIIDMHEGSFYKISVPAPISALSFERSLTNLLVCTEPGELYDHVVGENRQLQPRTKFAPFVGMQMGELVKVTHQLDEFTPLLISTELTEFSQSGEILFGLSPQSLQKIAKVASALASLGQSAQVRLGYSQSLGVIGIFADKEGGSILLGREGFLARVSKDSEINETSIFISGMPMHAFGSPSSNYLWIITDTQAQLLDSSSLEVVLVAHRPFAESEDSEDIWDLVQDYVEQQWEHYSEEGFDDEDYVEEDEYDDYGEFQPMLRNSQTPAAAFSESDRFLALGWEDGVVEVFELGAEPNKVMEQVCHPGAIEALEIIEVGDKTILVVNGEDRKLSVWDLSGNRLATSLGDVWDKVSTFAYVPSVQRLVFGTTEGSVFSSTVGC